MDDGVLKLRKDRVEWRQVEGEIVALDLKTSQYLGINRAGAILWPHLAEGATVAALKERLAGEFGLDDETAARDVEAFLASLRAQDLLEE